MSLQNLMSFKSAQIDRHADRKKKKQKIKEENSCCQVSTGYVLKLRNNQTHRKREKISGLAQSTEGRMYN